MYNYDIIAYTGIFKEGTDRLVCYLHVFMNGIVKMDMFQWNLQVCM